MNSTGKEDYFHGQRVNFGVRSDVTLKQPSSSLHTNTNTASGASAFFIDTGTVDPLHKDLHCSELHNTVFLAEAGALHIEHDATTLRHVRGACSHGMNRRSVCLVIIIMSG